MTCSVRKTTTIVVICVAAAFFLPTSINGEQIEIINSVVNAVLFGLVMALLVKRGVLSKSKAIISLVMLAYLLLASLVIIIQNAGSLSLARAIPVSLILLLSVVEFKEIDFPVKWTVHLIDVLTIVIFIWNILCMIHFDPLERFVLNNYIQLDDYTATTYSLMQSKPIFTFGVHNFASTFYLALFFVCSKLFHLGYGRRFLFFMLVYAVFTVLLNSTASIGTFMLMVLYAGCTTVAQKKNGLKYIEYCT